MQRYIYPLLILLLASPVMGQQSRKMKFPLGGQINIEKAAENDFFPTLQRLEAPFPGGKGYRSYLEGVKQQLPELRKDLPMPTPGSAKTGVAATNPVKGTNFVGNTYINGVPNDNDLAISNDGKMVSVINSNIFFFEEDGTGLGNISLANWADTLGLTASKYDPRAAYDPIHDRFIIVCLNGFVDSTSMIIVGFSQTNDPTGDWNMYALPGDPNNDTLWTDYPIIALSHDELFLTGNLLRNNESWQLGFAESICWQIDLDKAYAGDSLETMLWFDVNFNGAPIRNLCPAQGGPGPDGPNMYLVSNRNFAVANDTVFIMEITDSINGNPQYLVDYGLSSLDYGMPPNAIQQFTQQLATNDARWLDAMVENGNLHFVGNSLAPTTNKVGIYHGIINDIGGTRTVTGTMLTDSILDYGYPAITFAGLTPTDHEAMILANYTGTTTRTTYGVIFYDGIDYSDVVEARPGQSYINAISGIDRWGDYSGLQTRYNQPGTVWSAATYARFNQIGGTWICEYTNPNFVATESPRPLTEVKAFPNPIENLVQVEFDLEEEVFGEITLLDAQGRVVELFLRDRLRSGLNRFIFSAEPLPAGLYLLQVKADGDVLATKKVIKK